MLPSHIRTPTQTPTGTPTHARVRDKARSGQPAPSMRAPVPKAAAASKALWTVTDDKRKAPEVRVHDDHETETASPVPLQESEDGGVGAPRQVTLYQTPGLGDAAGEAGMGAHMGARGPSRARDRPIATALRGEGA